MPSMKRYFVEDAVYYGRREQKIKVWFHAGYSQ